MATGFSCQYKTSLDKEEKEQKKKYFVILNIQLNMHGTGHI